MATNDSTGTGSGETATKECNLLYLYLHDVSFEAPHVPSVLFGHKRPSLEFDYSTDYTLSADKSSDLGEVYSVTVQVTVKATDEDKTLFLIEVRQGGIFEVVGCPPEDLDFFLRTKPVETLFPFCRELITSLVARAGFPNVRLRAIDFEKGYSQVSLEHRDALRKAQGNA